MQLYFKHFFGLIQEKQNVVQCSLFCMKNFDSEVNFQSIGMAVFTLSRKGLTLGVEEI
jgi:hypothetical protein